MFITPQLIKDQEFQTKFKGFDPIEVKDYLEIIANEFFELQEQCKEQLEELESLREAKESSEEYNNSLETDMEFTRKISEELKDGCAQKEEKVKELTGEIEELKLRIADLEQENAEHDEEVSTVLASIEEAEDALKQVEKEKEILQSKIELLQEQNDELKKDEVSFKSTLSAAQQFAEDLKEKSKVQAEEMIAEANGTITKIREDAKEELARLPLEIDALKKKKGEVKAELKSTLMNYLETIEVFYPDEDIESDTKKDESSELFQKVELNMDGSLKSEGDENPEINVDEKVIDSLLSGNLNGTEEGGDAILKGMFSLDINGEDEKQGSS
ncbi:MAG TPA: DivIVA domain-containing protein [Desulfobacterales bacterium]|nr:DivIVA domain-containing protein [Desulfobacterales bacterium]